MKVDYHSTRGVIAVSLDVDIRVNPKCFGTTVCVPVPCVLSPDIPQTFIVCENNHFETEREGV